MANESVETRGYKIGIERNTDDTTYSPTGAHGISEWSVTGVSGDNAAVTVTKAAVSGKSHFITMVSGSNKVVRGNLMTLKDGATTIGNFHVQSNIVISFAKPIKITSGNAVELSLAAGGSAGDIGAVTMTGYTKAV